jgi:hypothetical protein
MEAYTAWCSTYNHARPSFAEYLTLPEGQALLTRGGADAVADAAAPVDRFPPNLEYVRTQLLEAMELCGIVPVVTLQDAVVCKQVMEARAATALLARQRQIVELQARLVAELQQSGDVLRLLRA